jgi:hypothetical protein
MRRFSPESLIQEVGVLNSGSRIVILVAGRTSEEHLALGDLFIDGDLPETDLHIFSSKYGFLLLSIFLQNACIGVSN